jgi:hypothetical protein
MAHPIKPKNKNYAGLCFKDAVRTANSTQATSSLHKPAAALGTLRTEGEFANVGPSGAREWAGIAQSVQRLAMVRGSNPGGSEIFRTRPDRAWGPPSLLYNGYRVFPWG